MNAIAENASRLIQERGWARKQFTGPGGELCLASALRHAAATREAAECDFGMTREEAVRLIQRHFPERLPGCDCQGCRSLLGVISIFNDHPLTIQEDVEFILKQIGT